MPRDISNTTADEEPAAKRQKTSHPPSANATPSSDSSSSSSSSSVASRPGTVATTTPTSRWAAQQPARPAVSGAPPAAERKHDDSDNDSDSEGDIPLSKRWDIRIPEGSKGKANGKAKATVSNSNSNPAGTQTTKKRQRRHADNSLTDGLSHRNKQTAEKRVHRPEAYNSWIKTVTGKLGRPVYVARSDPAAGGQKATAKLGPNSLLSSNSDANSKLPKGKKEAEEKYKTVSFKSGHLLNHECGGDGNDSANLTILTASANTTHSALEQNLKKSVEELKKLYRYMYDYPLPDLTIFKKWTDTGPYIAVTVWVEGQWGRDIPDSYIAQTLRMKAELHNSDVVADLLIDDPHKNRQIIESIRTIRNFLANANGAVMNKKPH